MPLLRGWRVLAIAMSEPDAGSGLAGMKGRVIDCSDHRLLNGARICIPSIINADVVIEDALDEATRLGLFDPRMRHARIRVRTQGIRTTIERKTEHAIQAGFAGYRAGTARMFALYLVE